MNLKSKILEFVEGDNSQSFNTLALDIFRYQARENETYRSFLDILGVDPSLVDNVSDIPCLPIQLFKSRAIKSGNWEGHYIFKSSGTTDMFYRSMHHVNDLSFYHRISASVFRNFYPFRSIEILALLPSYIEAGQSSLVSMVKHLMETHNDTPDAFYLYDFETLFRNLDSVLSGSDKHAVLFGVSYALLDFAKQYSIDNDRLRIVFTGGMKNKRSEMDYHQIYSVLKAAFPSSSIDSEYGMTEMFSQAYALENPDGWFVPGRSLKVIARELTDPFSNTGYGKTGQLAFIDLANIDTLSFVQTDDLCQVRQDGTFRIIGRVSAADQRGCHMLYQN